MLITTPAKCSFKLYITSNGLWGDTLQGGVEHTQGAWIDLFKQLATSYIYRRLIFDTPQGRQRNKLFFVYNPYLTEQSLDLEQEERELEELYGPPISPVKQTSDPLLEAGIAKIKRELEKMIPYVTFMQRIHNDVMDNPTTTHLMFQKSIFYEVLFFYCQHNTSENLLSTLMTGINSTYLGFSMASMTRMRIKYTGKQYISIIPRGLGKTRCIRLVFAVALVTFRGCQLLAMAHTKSLVYTTKDDIENTLETCFPPSKYNYTRCTHEESLIIEFPGEPSNRLKYLSACRPASLRGNDPDIGFLDEALCVSQDSYGVINAMIQRMHTKIGFVSSPISSNKAALLNLVINMAIKCESINMYRLCYFCLDTIHVQYSASHTGCYRKLFAPRYITYNDENKSFEGVITRTNASYENELGVIRPEDITSGEFNADDMERNRAMFTPEFVSHLTSPTTYVRLNNLPVERRTAYWIYIDPTYYASKSSAIALCCVRFVKETVVICYMDRKLVSNGDLGRVEPIMEEMYAGCVTTVVRHSGRGTKCCFFLAIERNITPDGVQSCYSVWGDQTRRPGGKGVLTRNNYQAFYYADVCEGRCVTYGFLLGAQKKRIFSHIIRRFNKSHSTSFRIANTAEFGAYTRDTCTTEHLKQEIEAFHYKDKRYTGKLTNVSTDDLITCVIMATYLGVAFKADAPIRMQNIETEKKTNCTTPWLGARCTCPLRR